MLLVRLADFVFDGGQSSCDFCVLLTGRDGRLRGVGVRGGVGGDAGRRVMSTVVESLFSSFLVWVRIDLAVRVEFFLGAW